MALFYSHHLVKSPSCDCSPPVKTSLQKWETADVRCWSHPACGPLFPKLQQLIPVSGLKIPCEGYRGAEPKGSFESRWDIPSISQRAFQGESSPCPASTIVSRHGRAVKPSYQYSRHQHCPGEIQGTHVLGRTFSCSQYFNRKRCNQISP